MDKWGIAIPGLTMNASEIPFVPGLVQFQNPEVGDGVIFDFDYTLEDVAKVCLETIHDQFTAESDLTIIGISVGGMVNSILASKFRSQLPKKTRFVFIATTPNLKELPALPKNIWEFWISIYPDNIEDIKKALLPFFSKNFLSNHLEKVQQYFDYKIEAFKHLSPTKFFRQVMAVMQYDGRQYYPKMNEQECLFISGVEDYIFGARHVDAINSLVPNALHYEIEDLGHLFNLEAPEFFTKEKLDHLWNGSMKSHIKLAV